MLSTLLAVNPTNIVVDENGEAGDNIVRTRKDQNTLFRADTCL